MGLFCVHVVAKAIAKTKMRKGVCEHERATRQANMDERTLQNG